MGTANTENAPSKALLYLTAVLTLLVFFWGLGDTLLMSLNEGRRALVTQEMFATGNWFLPHMNGELYLAKPPFLYWCSSAFSTLFGHVNAWSLRLPSAIAALITVWTVYQFSLKNFGVWPALFSAQLLVANAGFAMLAHRAEIEMLLTALCIGAVLSAIQYAQTTEKRWAILSFALLGLAMMTKGPISLIFVVVPILLGAIITKDNGLKQLLKSPMAWVIFVVVGLSWYLLVSVQLGFDIWSATVKKDMLTKMQSEAVAKPVLSYVGWIAVDFMLLILLLTWRAKATFHAYKDNKSFIWISLAAFIPLIVFSLFSNKHAKYLLPIYPLLAILLAVHISQLVKAFKTTSEAQFKLNSLLGYVGVFFMLVYWVFYAFVEPKYFDYRVSAFPKIQQRVFAFADTPVYGYQELDCRVIYYLSRSVPMLDKATIETTKQQHSSFILLAEQDYAAELAASPHIDCVIETITPYLKKKKSFTIYGVGNVCQTASIKAGTQ